MKILHTYSHDDCDTILASISEENYKLLSRSKTKPKHLGDVKVHFGQPIDASAWYLPKHHLFDDIKNKIELFENKELDIQLNTDNPVVQKYTIDSIVDPHSDGYHITSILLLNDEFEGGELKVEGVDMKLKKGDLAIFYSSQKHWVERLINGTRYTLVTWFNYKNKNKNTLI